MVEFMCQEAVTNLVKSLYKIHNEDICLLIALQVVNERYQLRLAGSAPSEAML